MTERSHLGRNVNQTTEAGSRLGEHSPALLSLSDRRPSNPVAGLESSNLLDMRHALPHFAFVGEARRLASRLRFLFRVPPKSQANPTSATQFGLQIFLGCSLT